MKVLEAIMMRRSVREFTGQEVPESAVDALIDALLWAPSAGNLQSRKFFFVSRKDVKEALARAALGQRFIAAAPLAVVACLDRRISVRYGDRGVNLYAIQDAAASIENMMLVARDLGLGSCWIGAFNEFDVADVLELPGHLRPVAIVPVGYPAATPLGAPRRVPSDEAVTFVR